nr:porin family protein [Hymenobacter edaphi]
MHENSISTGFSGLFWGHCATAQQFRFGAKAGVNYSDSRVRGLTNDGTKPIVSYHCGAVGRYSFGADEFWNIQAELLYSRKGNQYEYTRQGNLGQNRFSYLELPLLAKINARGFTFEAGPQLGYLVARKTTTDVITRDRAGLRRLLLGYVAGVGYELTSGYRLSIRYNGDVLPIVPGGGLFQGPTLSVFQAQLGYLFGKAK